MYLFEERIHIFTWNLSHFSATGCQVMFVVGWIDIFPCLWKPHYRPVVSIQLLLATFFTLLKASQFGWKYVDSLLIGDRCQFYRFLLALEATQSSPCLPRDGIQFSSTTTSVLANTYWIPIYATEEKMLSQKIPFYLETDCLWKFMWTHSLSEIFQFHRHGLSFCIFPPLLHIPHEPKLHENSGRV